tara:strand:- start:3439 stop:3570 length:132 start_codon:yes stop_codon:yes gene_type:complete
MEINSIGQDTVIHVQDMWQQFTEAYGMSFSNDEEDTFYYVNKM